MKIFTTKKVIALSICITAVPIVFYVVNPYGTATYDPRARLLGIVPYQIPSNAMMPTLQKGDFILVNSAAYLGTQPEINDIIVFEYPENRHIDYVKRVVARGGDTLKIVKGKVWINDEELEQSYVADENNELTQQQHFGPIEVPPGMLFVLGDFRDNSRDSRYWGFVPIQNVVGKVTRIWQSDDASRIGPVK